MIRIFAMFGCSISNWSKATARKNGSSNYSNRCSRTKLGSGRRASPSEGHRSEEGREPAWWPNSNSIRREGNKSRRLTWMCCLLLQMLKIWLFSGTATCCYSTKTQKLCSFWWMDLRNHFQINKFSLQWWWEKSILSTRRWNKSSPVAGRLCVFRDSSWKVSKICPNRSSTSSTRPSFMTS